MMFIEADGVETKDLELILGEIVEMLASLSNQTSDLVDEYSTRVVKGKPADVRLRADQLRVNARSLRQALHKARLKTDSKTMEES